jgi:hypothetical protein
MLSTELVLLESSKLHTQQVSNTSVRMGDLEFIVLLVRVPYFLNLSDSNEHLRGSKINNFKVDKNQRSLGQSPTVFLIH